MPAPVALQLGPVAIHWYGLMYVLAFAMFLLLGRVRVKQPHMAALGWKNEDLDDMLFYGMLGVIIGGRLGEVLFYRPDYFFANREKFGSEVTESESSSTSSPSTCSGGPGGTGEQSSGCC